MQHFIWMFSFGQSTFVQVSKWKELISVCVFFFVFALLILLTKFSSSECHGMAFVL